MDDEVRLRNVEPDDSPSSTSNLVGYWIGKDIGAIHHYPALPTFGLPCPTTIFTVGVLAFAVRPYPGSPLIVPLLWCLTGAQAAFFLGVPQDLGLVAAAAAGVFLLVRRAPGDSPDPDRAV